MSDVLTTLYKGQHTVSLEALWKCKYYLTSSTYLYSKIRLTTFNDDKQHEPKCVIFDNNMILNDRPDSFMHFITEC